MEPMHARSDALMNDALAAPVRRPGRILNARKDSVVDCSEANVDAARQSTRDTPSGLDKQTTQDNACLRMKKTMGIKGRTAARATSTTIAAELSSRRRSRCCTTLVRLRQRGGGSTQ